MYGLNNAHQLILTFALPRRVKFAHSKYDWIGNQAQTCLRDYVLLRSFLTSDGYQIFVKITSYFDTPEPFGLREYNIFTTDEYLDDRTLGLSLKITGGDNTFCSRGQA